MSRWFRHYAGMMRDDKLVRVAIRAKQPVERVVWVWGAILESAAEIDDGGRYDLDAAEIAYFLRADEADVGRILDGLEECGRISEGGVVKWGDRQFSSDRSADRQRAYRERKRSVPANNGDADVTSLSRHGDAPETDTETDTDIPPNPPRGASGRTLIPENWEAPPVSDLPPKARACAEQWNPESYATHAEAFALYWRSERKMKADWRGTWANRVIALHSQVMRDQKFGNAPPAQPKKPAGPLTLDELRNAIRYRRDIGDEAKAQEYEIELKARAA